MSPANKQNYNNKKKKLDFHKKRFDNPYLSKQRKKKKRIYVKKISFKKILTSLALLAVISVFYWFFFFCPVWNLDAIEIHCSQRIPPDEIKNIVKAQSHTDIFPISSPKSLILFDTKQLKEEIKNNFHIKNIRIAKNWPDALKINIQEEPYAYIWLEKKQYYHADKEGYIIKRLPLDKYDQKNEQLPLIENKAGKTVYGDRIKANQKYINFIQNIHDELNKKLNDIRPEKFIIPKEEQTIKVILKQGPALYFDINESCHDQLDRLYAVKNKKIKNDFDKKEYIDLRYADRIYYR